MNEATSASKFVKADDRMDLEEARRVLYTRVQCLDSVNVLKIIGYLLLQDMGEQEMLQLAVAPDPVLECFVAKAKQDLRLMIQPTSVVPCTEEQSASISGASLRPVSMLSMEIQQEQQLQALLELHQQQKANQFFDMPEYHLDAFRERSSSSNSLCYESTSSALAWKPCLYFARGYCKHGSGCRFLHVPGRNGSFSSLSDDSQDSGEPVLHTESLEHLEIELRELLSGRRAPVSIASLPQLYYERFGKMLQADGYLTESQRHGKSGYSLTKLLARLKHAVTLIDRPHGQHAVVLAEEAHKFLAYRGEGEDLLSTTVNPSSRQIYLTFPAESSFSEEDVTTHFSAYGPVQDVRIPYQQKRMFGFVTFTYSETVRTILAEGNPHYICGARVLVKPYKEKGKHDKKGGEQPKQLQCSRSLVERRDRQSALRYYLQDQALARSAGDDEATMALQLKLAELHFANVQKKLAEIGKSTVISPAAPFYEPDHQFFTEIGESHSAVQGEGNVLPANPFNYVLDVLDTDEPKSQPSEEQVLPCNLQSDQKKLQKLLSVSGAANTPTFFAHDIF